MTKLAGIALWAVVVAGVTLGGDKDVRAGDPCKAGLVPGAKGECIACPAGSFAAAGATGCSPCPAGSFSGIGAGSCVPCAAGTFSKVGAATCDKCPAGTSSTAGAGSCTAAANKK